jgi:hypothetical protein
MTPGHSVAELSEFFISIFEDILLLEQLVEPDVKRSRMSDVFNEFSFSVNFPVWMGRRPIRRQLAPQHKNLSLLELEREVTIRKYHTGMGNFEIGVFIY